MNPSKVLTSICCAIALLMTSAVAFATAGTPTNRELAAGFLTNANMALGTKTPTGWSLGSYRVGKISLIRDTKVFKSAPASLCVDTHGKKASSFVFQQLLKNPVKPLQIGCWIKVRGKFPPKSIQLALQVFDARWHQIDWIPLALPMATTHWQHLGANATLPKAAVHTLLGVSFSGNGKIWIDDVAVQMAVAPKLHDHPLISAGAKSLSLVIAPSNPNLRYIGRFDTSQPASPRCAWANSSVTIRFNAAAINVKMAGGGADYWQVVLDSRPIARLKMIGKPALFRLADHLKPGVHEITLVKRGEPIFGVTRILGFELSSGGKVLPVPPNHRHLEVIGDSISVGFGNQGPNQYAPFSADTEDAYMSYGAIAARKLHAEYACIAWSGKCLWPHNSILKFYGLTLPPQAKSVWNFARWKPQAVLINLGTNDFAAGNPPEKGWVGAYEKFVAKLRHEFPGVSVFCALSPMLSDPWSKSKNARTTCGNYLKAVVAHFRGQGHKKVYYLDFPMQNGSRGFGAMWHPSVKEDRYMAGIMAEIIAAKLGW